MDQKILLIVIVCMAAVLSPIWLCIIRSFLVKFDTPWRVIDRNNEYKIQQKFGKFWITTYQFAYGCTDQAEIKRSYLGVKTRNKKYTKVIKEYPDSNHE